MKEMRVRVRRITEDLNALLRELSTSQGVNVGELIEEILTVEVMQDFKASVDAMRHLLWVYIEAASRASDGAHDINLAVQSLRLQRATEMLKGLREGGVPISTQYPEGRTFVTQVQAVVEYYSNPNSAGRKPDAEGDRPLSAGKDLPR